MARLPRTLAVRVRSGRQRHADRPVRPPGLRRRGHVARAAASPPTAGRSRPSATRSTGDGDRRLHRHAAVAARPTSGFPRISRYLLTLYRGRPDLHAPSRQLAGLEGNHFLWWVKEMGHGSSTSRPSSSRRTPTSNRRPSRRRPLRPGVRRRRVLRGRARRGRARAGDVVGPRRSSASPTPSSTSATPPAVSAMTTVDAASTAPTSTSTSSASTPIGSPPCSTASGSSFTRNRRTIGAVGVGGRGVPGVDGGSAGARRRGVDAERAIRSRAIRAAIDKPVHTFPPPVVERPVIRA